MRLSQATVALAVGASLAASSGASAQAPERAATQIASGVRLIGTPSVRYSIVRRSDGQRHVSIAAVFRTDRALDRSRYSTIVAPSLRRGQQVPDALFGGLTAARIGNRYHHCFIAEPAQLKRRTRIEERTWRLGLVTGDRVTGRVKRVTLKRASSDRWQHAAAARLGC